MSWTLNGTVEILRLLSIGHGDFVGENPSDIIKGGFLLWEGEKEYDPTTGTVDYLTPILEQIETTLQSDYNTEISAIDSNLDALDSTSIIIEDFGLLPTRFPWVQIFPDGESPVESEIENVMEKINWRIITAITIKAETSTTLITNLDTYLTAMQRALIKS